MGVVVDNKLKLFAAAATKATWIQNCIHGGMMSKDRDMVIPLYAELVRPQLEYCVHLWSPQFKKIVNRVRSKLGPWR